LRVVRRPSSLPPEYDIRELRLDDATALAEAYRRNREHLAPWEPNRDESFFTPAGQEAAIAGRLAAASSSLGGSWVVTTGEVVVGLFNLVNVVMGSLRSGDIGYWVDRDHQGRGLATTAVRAVCDEARARGLHRVAAGTLVHNEASQTVLRRCGFERYGTAPEYLFIAGAWRDHHLYQRILHRDPL
jgi:ribosomal-protein-alanine N-acetyltransferase